jgi:hypothetical protein
MTLVGTAIRRHDAAAMEAKCSSEASVSQRPFSPAGQNASERKEKGPAMTKTTKLTKRQRALIEDLFTGEMEERDVLAGHGVSRSLYDRWLADERFTREFERRIAQAYTQSRVILARYATVAATRLIHLTTCEKEETARKACLDILARPRAVAPEASPTNRPSEDPEPEADLSPETARRLLAALAQEQEDEDVSASG